MIFLPPSKASGNAFFYILIAVVLFAALGFAISKGNDANPSGEINDAAAKTAVISILAYEAQAKMALNQMIQNGAKVDDIIFDPPSTSSFNTAPTINKLFHPDGGGLQYKALPKAALTGGSILTPPNAGYYIGRFNNFEWTPTTKQDVIFTAYGISVSTCAELINKALGKGISIGNWGDVRPKLINSTVTGIANSNFNAADWPSANGKAAFCQFMGSKTYAYYSILVAR